METLPPFYFRSSISGAVVRDAGSKELQPARATETFSFRENPTNAAHACLPTSFVFLLLQLKFAYRMLRQVRSPFTRFEVLAMPGGESDILAADLVEDAFKGINFHPFGLQQPDGSVAFVNALTSDAPVTNGAFTFPANTEYLEHLTPDGQASIREAVMPSGVHIAQNGANWGAQLDEPTGSKAVLSYYPDRGPIFTRHDGAGFTMAERVRMPRLTEFLTRDASKQTLLHLFNQRPSVPPLESVVAQSFKY